MTARVPDTNPERDRLVRKLEADLARFRRVPAHRRDAECADEGEATCLALLRDLGIEPPTV